MKCQIEERCKLCGGDLQYLFQANKCKLAKCDRCGFVQVINTDMIPDYKYDQTYFTNNKYKDNNALKKEHLRRTTLLMKYCEGGKPVLDYGCASGEFVRFIAHRYKVEGCDISAEAIAIAKNKNKSLSKKFWCISEPRDVEKKYSAICLWDVIEHLPNPYGTLLEIKKMMKNGGYILISTPNIGAKFATILKNKWPFMTPPEHLSFFSYKSIHKLAELLDMEVIEWSSKGKWANVGFILYKFNRVSNIKIPDRIIKIFQNTCLSKWNIYVPTCDIQYVVLKSNEK